MIKLSKLKSSFFPSSVWSSLVCQTSSNNGNKGEPIAETRVDLRATSRQATVADVHDESCCENVGSFIDRMPSKKTPCLEYLLIFSFFPEHKKYDSIVKS